LLDGATINRSGQVVATQEFPALAPVGVHVCTGALVVSTAVQVVCTKLLPALAGNTAVARAPPSTQSAGFHPVGPVTFVPQVDDVQGVPVTGLLPTTAESGVQVATGTALFATTGVGQVIVIQLLPEAAVCGEHEPTGVLM